ncbi:DUF7696 family protein [Pseudomonas sp.]|uniref:DUF7696 family protein n=1 Tax=Pseudomonas sp. TaxID=306 RepID=UPI003D0DCDD6
MTVSNCLLFAMRRLAAVPADKRDDVIATLPETCPHSNCTTGMGCRAYVDSVAGSAVEQKRRICEARHHIRRGCNTPEKVTQLMKTVAGLRGQAAAELLRDEMRAQWKTRSAWLRGGR